MIKIAALRTLDFQINYLKFLFSQKYVTQMYGHVEEQINLKKSYNLITVDGN